MSECTMTKLVSYAVPHRSTVNTHSDLPLITLQSRFKYWVAQKLIGREGRK